MNIEDVRQLFDLSPPQGSFSWSAAFYRGHASASWDLQPSFFRYDPLPKEHKGNWQSLESFAMAHFRSEAHPYLDQSQSNNLYYLQMAQHFGMPTRLMDWSKNPLVALFFAVEDLNNEDDGALYISRGGHSLSGTGGSGDVDLNSHDCTRIFPTFTDARIVAQQGAFTVHKLPERDQTFVPVDQQTHEAANRLRIEKHLIPTKAKPSIKKQLEIFGIDRAALFPGLDGIGYKMKWQFERESRYGFS